MTKESYIKKNIKYFPLIEKVGNLSSEEKRDLYWDYYLDQLERKHDFVGCWSEYKKRPDTTFCDNRYEYPYIKLKEPKVEYPYKHMDIIDQEGYISKDNIMFYDFGKDYKKDGRAARYRLEFSGIYNNIKLKE
jgi:hypothetical protein